MKKAPNPSRKKCSPCSVNMSKVSPATEKNKPVSMIFWKLLLTGVVAVKKYIPKEVINKGLMINCSSFIQFPVSCGAVSSKVNKRKAMLNPIKIYFQRVCFSILQMYKTRYIFIIFGYIIFSPHCKSNRIDRPAEVFRNAGQLVVVTSPNDSSTLGTLSRYEKKDGQWILSGNPHQVTLGRTGLAWGSGIHDASLVRGTPKKEGDGKSPAGFFLFGPAFGYAPAGETDFKLPYLQATSTVECVDDGLNPRYNQLADTREVVKDWNSSEKMLREDHQYRWGIVVNHNVPAKSMRGSCIFFHIWSAPGAATAGCTAMMEEHLLELMHWLDPARQPVLVQLTEPDYKKMSGVYGLPF